MIQVDIKILELKDKYQYFCTIVNEKSNIFIKFNNTILNSKDVAVFSSINKCENIIRKLFEPSEKVQYTINNEQFSEFYL